MTTTRGWHDEVTLEIAAGPDQLWELIADVTRMGEWSPVCRRCAWTDGSARADLGARFIGHNRQGPARWSRLCEVTVSDPGRELSFRTLFKGREATRWHYRLESTATGTRVIESYEVVAMPRWVQLLHRLPGMHARARRDGVRNMTHTLQRLRAEAERGPLMAPRSPSIDDPLTGQHLTFTHTANATRGTSLRAVVCLEPGGFVPRHLHLRQDEHLEVLTGSIRLRAGGTSRLLSAGDTATIPRRHVHRVANAGASEASFVLEVHPARRIERTIRLSFAVGRALRPLATRRQVVMRRPGSGSSL